MDDTHGDKDPLILEHYKRLAKSHGESPLSSMRDQYIRSAETNFFITELRSLHSVDSEIKILDAGCGNGYLLSVLREEFPNAHLFGLEFTPELYEVAKKRELTHCHVQNGDARKSNSFEPDFFDAIISERMIINILNRKQQYKALDNIFLWLKKSGRYLLAESFREPLLHLNRARKEVCLEEIPIPPYNLYPYEESFERYREKIGLQVDKQGIPQNYLSTHFYLSRVVHLLSRPPGGKIRDTEFVKFFNEALPPGIGNYSPILFKKYKKP